MDQSLQPKSESRLRSQAPFSEDHFDWLSQRTRWFQQPIWQGPSEIANGSVRSQANEVSHYRDVDAVDEELLDELFADGELISLL